MYVLSNKHGGWNKRGGGAKFAKSLNVEHGIYMEGGILWNAVISKLFFNLVGHSHYKCGGAKSFLNMVEHIHF